MEKLLGRRKFLQLGCGFTAAAAFAPLLRFAPASTSAKTEELTEQSFHFTTLQQWQEYIEPEKEALRPLFEGIDLYGGAMGLTLDDQAEDFRLYYDIWRMGGMYDIPTEMMIVQHLYESTVSRNKNPDKHNPNKGAMQLWEEHLQNPLYQNALEEIRNRAGFLAEIKGQRYLKGLQANGDGTISETNDWEMILLAAFYIANTAAVRYPLLSSLNQARAYETVVEYNYSLNRGPQDVQNFRHIRGILQPALEKVTLTLPDTNPIQDSPSVFWPEWGDEVF